jgi:tRNA-splicing ligase RtcB (3'-phosphate/5'-hydroxy nucleic acid ligase)
MRIEDIKVFGDHDEATLSQIRRCAKDDAVKGAVLCADGHKGYAVPIGGVVAYEGKVSPSGIGFDIGCGNKAVLTDIPAAEVQANIRTVMDDIWKNLSFGIGRNNETRVEHELFDDPAWKLPPVNSLKQMAQNQLGTIGSGVSRLAW